MTWSDKNPGCAPESCGGMRLDPCSTVMRTRGRWHDGEVPATAAEAVKIWIEGQSSRELASTDPCPGIVAVVADWLRAQSRIDPAIRDGNVWQSSVDWAADQLDGRDRGRSPVVKADPGRLITLPPSGPQQILVRFEPEFEAAIMAAARRLADEAGVPVRLLTGEGAPTSGEYMREYERPTVEAWMFRQAGWDGR